MEFRSPVFPPVPDGQPVTRPDATVVVPSKETGRFSAFGQERQNCGEWLSGRST